MRQANNFKDCYYSDYSCVEYDNYPLEELEVCATNCTHYYNIFFNCDTFLS